MYRILLLLATIVSAWLVHVGLVSTYMKLFTNTHSLSFRALYALEISLVFSLAFALYVAKAKNPIPVGVTIITVILFLIIVDSVLAISLKNVRSSFDLLHFMVAYTAVASGLLLVYKL